MCTESFTIGVCVRGCVRACMCACACVCVRACVYVLADVEVDTLSRDDLYDVIDEVPSAAKAVRDAAVRVALKRTVKLLKAYADKAALDEQIAEADGKNKGTRRPLSLR